MLDIPQRADGVPVYRATYSLTAEGSWLITVETERGAVRVSAARLADVERRAYNAIRQHLDVASGTFDVTFAHEIDLTEGSRLKS